MYYSYYSNNPLVTTQFTLKHIENFHKKTGFSLRFSVFGFRFWFLERFRDSDFSAKQANKALISIGLLPFFFFPKIVGLVS
jgi:hypothetical protein